MFCVRSVQPFPTSCLRLGSSQTLSTPPPGPTRPVGHLRAGLWRPILYHVYKYVFFLNRHLYIYILYIYIYIYISISIYMYIYICVHILHYIYIYVIPSKGAYILIIIHPFVSQNGWVANHQHMPDLLLLY